MADPKKVFRDSLVENARELCELLPKLNMTDDPNLEAIRKELTAMGHQISMRGDFSSSDMGSGQAVRRDFKAGVNFGASDPRKDGAAGVRASAAPTGR